jgi:hypothetical protein
MVAVYPTHVPVGQGSAGGTAPTLGALGGAVQQAAMAEFGRSGGAQTVTAPLLATLHSHKPLRRK